MGDDLHRLQIIWKWGRYGLYPHKGIIAGSTGHQVKGIKLLILSKNEIVLRGWGGISIFEFLDIDDFIHLHFHRSQVFSTTLEMPIVNIRLKSFFATTDHQGKVHD